jgi:hypothetical protein
LARLSYDICPILALVYLLLLLIEVVRPNLLRGSLRGRRPKHRSTARA